MFILLLKGTIPYNSRSQFCLQILFCFAEDLSSCLKQINELRSTMMSTLSEITANVAALEKKIIEMTSNNMDEKHKCPLYPLQDAAGTDILF